VLDTYIEVTTKVQLQHAFRCVPDKGASMIVFVHPRTGSKTKFRFNGRVPALYYQTKQKLPVIPDKSMLEKNAIFERRLIRMSIKVKRSEKHVWK